MVGTERGDVGFDEALQLFGFARERDRRFVGVGHDGAIRGVGGLVELNAQVGGQLARLHELGEDGVRFAAAAARKGHSERGEQQLS